MKHVFLLILSFCSSSFLSAQIQKLSTHQVTIEYQLDLGKDVLDLISYEVFPKVENKLTTANCQLQNNELIINYGLNKPGKEGYYILSLDIKMDGQNVETQAGYLLGDIGRIQLGTSKTKTIIWTNLIPQLPHAQGQLTLTLKAEWWGIQYLAYGVNCDEYPTFGFKEKLPFYAGLAAGAGAIATGLVLRNKADQHFDRHKEAVRLSERNDQYQEYSDKMQTAEIVTYVGVGILAADVIFYFLRKEKHKKQIRVFEEFCNEGSLSIRPVWELPSAESEQSIGLRFSYQF